MITADEMMIGADILVAPVTAMGAITRKVYLPAGHWIDAWDPMRAFDGPREIMVDAPIGRPPVFTLSGRQDLAGVR